MLAAKKDIIQKELEEGTGAAMAVVRDRTGLRSALRIWFADLDEKHGPIAELRPHGLKGHRVDLIFGSFSAAILAQISRASPEDVQLARALVSSIQPQVELDIPGQDRLTWLVTDGRFRITAKVRDLKCPDDDNSVITTCREVIVPLMAAMAELIGYDVIEEGVRQETAAYDGAILVSTVKRRERNPRNRLLCIRIHGEKCVACGCEPKTTYGRAGSIIEVHHLEPVSLLTEPRPYDPRTDLVPLCPNCHRAVHTRRPAPLSIEELRSLRETRHD